MASDVEQNATVGPAYPQGTSTFLTSQPRALTFCYPDASREDELRILKMVPGESPKQSIVPHIRIPKTSS